MWYDTVNKVLHVILMEKLLVLTYFYQMYVFSEITYELEYFVTDVSASGSTTVINSSSTSISHETITTMISSSTTISSYSESVVEVSLYVLI